MRSLLYIESQAKYGRYELGFEGKEREECVKYMDDRKVGAMVVGRDL